MMCILHPGNPACIKTKKNQFFGNFDINNNKFEVLEMENRVVENRKEEIAHHQPHNYYIYIHHDNCTIRTTNIY